MKSNSQACSATGPSSPLFRDFHHFLQVCIEDLDRLSAQEDPASANHAVKDTGNGAEHER